MDLVVWASFDLVDVGSDAAGSLECGRAITMKTKRAELEISLDGFNGGDLDGERREVPRFLSMAWLVGQRGNAGELVAVDGEGEDL